jgi:hypothetical protein
MHLVLIYWIMERWPRSIDVVTNSCTDKLSLVVNKSMFKLFVGNSGTALALSYVSVQYLLRNHSNVQSL